jgi:hypothetical protein
MEKRLFSRGRVCSGRVPTGIGSAGGSEKRTSFVTQVTVAIPFSRWGAQPYITHPFLFPIASADAVRAPINEAIAAEEEVRHPIRLGVTTPKQIRLRSERRLRPIVACSDHRVRQRLVHALLATVAQ